MKITVLVENHAPANLASEHGLSFWIETPEGSVLFDTGQGPAFQANVCTLNIPLDSARALVLSHGHYDHTGGLAYALERNPSAPIYLHPDALDVRYSFRTQGARLIDMPKPARTALYRERERIRWTRGPTKLFPGLHVTGAIPRVTDYEDTGGSFYLDQDGRIPDPLHDDQALWAQTPKGLVIVLGCAHSGVVNTMDTICALTEQDTVYAVLGGMHLLVASPIRLQKTVEAIKRREVQILAPGHCTGDPAIAFLREQLPDRTRACHGGTVLEF